VIRHHLAGSGIEAEYAEPPPADYQPATWWLSFAGWLAVRREAAAFLSYWYRYGLSPFACT
jgi:hypothetical protein